MLQERRMNPRTLKVTHNREFLDWFEQRVSCMQCDEVDMKTKQLKALSSNPLFDLKSYSGYEVNGYKFHTKERASTRIVQNCGVIISADTTCFSSAQDRNPQSSRVDYYGVVKEIIEVAYMNSNSIVLFKCDWFDVANPRNVRYDDFGFTSVKTSAFLQTNEQFILASQARQVYYAKEPMDGEWSVEVDVEPRKQFNMGLHMLVEGIESHQDIISPRLDDGGFDHNRTNIESDEVDESNTVGNLDTGVGIIDNEENEEGLEVEGNEVHEEEEEDFNSDEETDEDMNEANFDEGATDSSDYEIDSEIDVDAMNEDDSSAG